MPAPLRQQILDVIVTRLKGITTTGGYNLQIADKVYDWRMSPLVPEALPAIEVRDKEATISVIDLSGSVSHTLNIDIVVMASGRNSAATVRLGLQDIAAALHVDRTFGGLAQIFTPESSTIEMQQDEDLLAAGQYSINLTYHTGPGEI